MSGLCWEEEWALHGFLSFFLSFWESSRLARYPPQSLPYVAVLPQLVALHAVAVIECDRAGVGHGIKAGLLGVLGVSRPDVLSPGEGEHLYTQGQHHRDGKAWTLAFFL